MFRTATHQKRIRTSIIIQLCCDEEFCKTIQASKNAHKKLNLLLFRARRKSEVNHGFRWRKSMIHLRFASGEHATTPEMAAFRHFWSLALNSNLNLLYKATTKILQWIL